MKEAIQNVVDYLNPLSDKFYVKLAFIPSDGYFQTKQAELRQILESRIPIMVQLSQISDQVQAAYQTGANGTPPEFKTTLPAKYGGGTVQIIDFQYYTQYRALIHGIIIMVAYFFFIRKMLRRLPQIIYMG